MSGAFLPLNIQVCAGSYLTNTNGCHRVREFTRIEEISEEMETRKIGRGRRVKDGSIEGGREW